MSKAIESGLAKAISTVLKPLVRVLIRNEVSVAAFEELARQAYVDVAYRHFAIPKRKTTYSRVAVLTGLSRKEVVRLAKLREQPEPPVKSNPNRAVRVINGWLQDAEFLDGHRKPRILPLQGEVGSFAALVARYSGDITLGAVLDELERLGIVARPDKLSVSLLSMGYIPADDELEKVRIMSLCTADLLATAVHNLDHRDEDARFQRQISFHNISDEVASEFKQLTNDRSTELLQELNQFLSSRKTLSTESGVANNRVGLGIYYIENEFHTEENDNA